jgi:hypothetical protein
MVKVLVSVYSDRQGGKHERQAYKTYGRKKTCKKTNWDMYEQHNNSGTFARI